MKKTTLLLLALSLNINLNSQNSCASALTITEGATTTVGTINGTANNTCGWAAPATNGEWYSYTATSNGVINITSDFIQNDGGLKSDDTRLSVFTGTCAALTCYTGGDDIDNFNWLTDITFAADSGVTYYFLWDNRWSSKGFDFNLTETPITCPSTFPLTEDFDSANQYVACYTVEDTDGDGFAWIQQLLDLDNDTNDESFATASTSGAAQNNWLFSPPLTLVNGADYVINFKFNGADGANVANESLAVVLIDAAASTGNVLTSLYSATGIVQNGTFEFLEAFATAPSINYTSTASGTYYLAFHVTSPANAAFLLLFDYDITSSLGVGDFESNTFKHFYNKDYDVLTLDSSKSSFDNIELYNLLGQQVLNKNLSQNRELINLSSLVDGLYIGKVRIDNREQTIKLLKQ